MKRDERFSSPHDWLTKRRWAPNNEERDATRSTHSLQRCIGASSSDDDGRDAKDGKKVSGCFTLCARERLMCFQCHAVVALDSLINNHRTRVLPLSFSPDPQTLDKRKNPFITEAPSDNHLDEISLTCVCVCEYLRSRRHLLLLQRLFTDKREPVSD